MGLRKGDRLTLRRAATVWLTQYDALKPQVTFSRELGSDPEADRKEMERVCYVELHRAILQELRSRTYIEKHMGPKMLISKVRERCKEVIRDGYDRAPETAVFQEGADERHEGVEPRKGKGKARRIQRR